MFHKEKYSFNQIKSKTSQLSLSPIKSKTIQNNKTRFGLMFLFVFISTFSSLMYTLDYDLQQYHANATAATTIISSSSDSQLEQSIQNTQQDLESSINKQVEQSFSNTLDSINNNNNSQENSATGPTDMQNSDLLITEILASDLENRFGNAGAILNITSNLPQVRNVSFANALNQTLTTLHGIPEDADIEKRMVAKNILSNYKDFQIIIFIMPNGDIYLEEPYSRQQISTTTNLGFRDYFQGVIETGDIHLGDPSPSLSSGQRQSVIAVPVHSLEDNSTIVGVWAGGLDFDILNAELQSLNLTSSHVDTRIVYVGSNGQKVADSDKNQASQPESFANLQSFKNAINEQSGSMMETINNINMMVTYQPVKTFNTTWAVLLMHPQG